MTPDFLPGPGYGFGLGFERGRCRCQLLGSAQRVIRVLALQAGARRELCVERSDQARQRIHLAHMRQGDA